MEAAATREGGPPLEGKPSPKAGEPEADINIARSSIDPDTQQFLARMVEAVPERYAHEEGGARGAKRDWESVREAAIKGGWNEAALKRAFEQKGGFLSDVEMERANQLKEASGGRALTSWDRAENLKKAGRHEEAELELDKYKSEMALVDSMEYALTGAKAEAARSLAYARRMAEGLTPEERFIASKFKAFKGEEKLYREFADAVKKKNWRRVSEVARELHKPSVMEQIMEGWRLGLLTGVPTHIVNWTGTGAKVSVIDPFEASFAGVLDSIIHPKDRSRYAGEGKAMLRGAWAAKDLAWEQLKNGGVVHTPNGEVFIPGLKHILDGTYEDMAAAAEVRGGDIHSGKFGHTGKIGGDVTILGQKVGNLDKFGRGYRSIYHLMGIADQYWKSLAGSQHVYRTAFRRGMQAGLKGDALENHIQQFVRDYAGKSLPDQLEMEKSVRLAEQQGTFNVPLKDSRGLIPLIGRLMNQATEKYPILTAIAPFIQTPVNIAGETIARTPIGVAKALLAMKRGTGTKGEQMEMLARGMAGSALASMIYTAIKTGTVEVSGGGPTDPDKKQNKIDTGWQPYSMRFGDKWVSYQRLEPISSIIGFAADLAEAGDSKTIVDKGAKLAASLNENLTNKTFLAQFSDTMEMMAHPNKNWRQWLRQMEGSAVPAIVARSAYALDPTVRVTDPTKRVYGVPEPIAARIPGLSTELEARKTPTGVERERAGGPVSRFLNPFPVSTQKEGYVADVQREFDRIGYVPAQPRREQRLSGGKTIELDDREYGILQGAYTDAARQAAKVIKTARYKRLSPDEQQEELEKVYNIARRRSRMLLYQDPKYRLRAARVQTGRE